MSEKMSILKLDVRYIGDVLKKNMLSTKKYPLRFEISSDGVNWTSVDSPVELIDNIYQETQNPDLKPLSCPTASLDSGSTENSNADVYLTLLSQSNQDNVEYEDLVELMVPSDTNQYRLLTVSPVGEQMYPYSEYSGSRYTQDSKKYFIVSSGSISDIEI